MGSSRDPEGTSQRLTEGQHMWRGRSQSLERAYPHSRSRERAHPRSQDRERTYSCSQSRERTRPRSKGRERTHARAHSRLQDQQHPVWSESGRDTSSRPACHPRWSSPGLDTREGRHRWEKVSMKEQKKRYDILIHNGTTLMSRSLVY